MFGVICHVSCVLCLCHSQPCRTQNPDTLQACRVNAVHCGRRGKRARDNRVPMVWSTQGPSVPVDFQVAVNIFAERFFASKNQGNSLETAEEQNHRLFSVYHHFIKGLSAFYVTAGAFRCCLLPILPTAICFCFCLMQRMSMEAATHAKPFESKTRKHNGQVGSARRIADGEAERD